MAGEAEGFGVTFLILLNIVCSVSIVTVRARVFPPESVQRGGQRVES
jgi:hypothetical protein